MKSQLASAFVIAAVACGGRGGEQAPAPVAGATDVPLTEDPVAVDDAIAGPQSTPDPVPRDGNVGAPQPNPDPLPIAGRGGSARRTEDPVPVADSAGSPSNVEAWQARAPEQYVIRTCGYGLGPPACSIAAVDQGQLVSRSNRFLPDEPWATAPIDDGTDPVESLFDEAGRSIDGCTTSFELDPVYAYPSQIYFDCGEEGWGVRVTCFEPDTVDASRCQ